MTPLKIKNKKIPLKSKRPQNLIGPTKRSFGLELAAPIRGTSFHILGTALNLLYFARNSLILPENGPKKAKNDPKTAKNCLFSPKNHDFNPVFPKIRDFKKKSVILRNCNFE